MPPSSGEIVERLREKAEDLRGAGQPTARDLLTEAADRIEELERKHIVGESIEQALREATSQLAECYRLTGADPDGDSDSMLAKFAVEEVGRLRTESDAAEGRVEAFEKALRRIASCESRAAGDVVDIARAALTTALKPEEGSE